MEYKTEIKKCSTCANASTELCKTCTYVSAVNGSESVPTHYCGVSDTDKNTILIDDLAAIITGRLDNHRLIDLRLVIEYNKRLEECINGKKKDLSAL